MRKKILKLYREDFESFKKLVSLLYGYNEESLKDVMTSEKYPEKKYFNVDDQIITIDGIIDSINIIAKQSRVLKQFNLI